MLGVALSGPAQAASPTTLKAPYERFVLDNGLVVILHEDHTLPKVSVNLWYHVGSAQERSDRTGFAHLFEHLMFEGSAHVPEGAFDTWLEEAGGQNNGSTTEDRTNYVIDVPAGALDLALFLESDRMGFLLETMTPSRVDGQRDIVKNERRQSYENRPYGVADLALPPLLYPKDHPYSWPVIGSMEHLSAASHDDVVSFFRRYYGPNNATLVIAGDFDPKSARRSVERWFNDIPRGPEVAAPVAPEVVLVAEKRVTLEDDVQLEKVILVWPTVPVFTDGDAALDALAEILGEGKNSRLYKRLVYDEQAAQDVTVYHASQRLAGTFVVEIMVRPGRTGDELVRLALEEIGRVQREGVDERELQRVKHQNEARFYAAYEKVGGFGGRADRLNLYQFYRGEPDSFAWDLARTQGLQRAEIGDVARRFLGGGRVRVDVRPRSQNRTATAEGR
ncbi:MAG: M16 family metallopeptidase [Myxococcota bacterium]